MSVYVGVVGAGLSDPKTDELAFEVGALLAEAGALVVCGGMTGVMEAVCRGAKSRAGRTLGILPGMDRRDANDYVDMAVPTGMGEMRNALIARTADVLIAVGGGFGTLSEVALARKIDKPVVSLGSWEVPDTPGGATSIITATNPQDAVTRAFGAIS